jgi:chemotaxis response regulator CheB
MKHRDITVIETSLGGIETLKEQIVQLAEDLPVAILVVLHLEVGRKSIPAES